MLQKLLSQGSRSIKSALPTLARTPAAIAREAMINRVLPPYAREYNILQALREKINTSGLTKEEVLAGLYNFSKAQGMGLLDYRKGPMLAVEAKKVLEEQSYVDYLKGRVIKVDFSTENEIESSMYDRDNGEGAARFVIDKLKKKEHVNELEYVPAQHAPDKHLHETGKILTHSVKLRNGDAVELGRTVNIFTKIKSIAAMTGPSHLQGILALIDLHTKALDPKADISYSLEFLQKKGLVNEDGTLDDTVASVVKNAILHDRETMKLTVQCPMADIAKDKGQSR